MKKALLLAFFGMLAMFSTVESPENTWYPLLYSYEEYDFGPKKNRFHFDLPKHLRIRNFRDPHGQGSCVHVSMAMLLRWQGQFQLADWWISQYSGGETHHGLIRKLEYNNIPYKTTYRQNNVRFLEDACRSGRGCMVTVMGGRHMVILVHLDDQHAYILDNNDINTVYKWDRRYFLREWKNAYSWATTPLYNPPPPLPYSEAFQCETKF